MKNFKYNKHGTIDCVVIHEKYGAIPTTLDDKSSKELIESGVEIAPYVEPVKTVEQVQALALDAINKTVEAECQSLTGTKLYFHDLNSAARHTSPDVQPDADIRARAVRLLQWDAEIDAYCDSVLFDISEGATMPTLDEFVAGLPIC